MKCLIKAYIQNFIFKIILPTFVICNLSFVISSAQAEEAPHSVWSTFGVAIANAPGKSIQQNPKITSDGIVVWEDGRSGYLDLYVQKVDMAGHPLWEKDGSMLCNAEGNQSAPQIISDGAGGAIIVWQDYRGENADIYAQHINASGEALWDTNGLAVSTAEAGQFAPQLISDGAGGAIIVWHDYRSGSGEDIYAQRMDGNGNCLWGSAGLAVSTTTGTQWYPKICSDGQQGAIVVWTDGRNGSFDNNIYAQRIDPTGKCLWEKDGIAVCAAPKNQEAPVIAPVLQGAVIAWADSRSGNTDIYAQKIDLTGKNLWGNDGVALATGSFDQENPQIAPDELGGTLVAWEDARAEKTNLYIQKISPEGKPTWTENGQPVASSSNKQTNPVLIKLQKENWLVVWEEETPGNNVALMLQKISAAGASLWNAEGIPLSAQSNAQETLSLALAPTGNILTAWQDKRNGDADIFVQNISPDGMSLWDSNGINVASAIGAVIQQSAQFTFSGRDIIAVYEDARSGFFNIYAQKISPAGELLWGQAGIPVAKVAGNQSKPQIIGDGSKGVFIVWEDLRQPDVPTIRLQHLTASGKKLFENSIELTALPSRKTKPFIITDKAGGAIVIWQDNRNTLSLQDIYAQRISKKGALLWGKDGKPIISANGDQVEADIITDGSGGAFVVWTDYRRGERNPDIYAQRINSQGEPLWAEDGTIVCGAPDVQHSPRIISDGEKGIMVCWTDKGAGSYDIYAQRVNSSGQPLWTADGIPISQLSRTQQNARFGNRQVLVWEDYRYGNWDIFAGAVSPGGKLLWPEEGFPLTTAQLTQYAPCIIPWKNSGAIIAWEDFRGGKFFELYLQKINSEGGTEWEENGTKNRSLDGGRFPKMLAAPSDNSFYLFWEDYTYGDKAIYGQKYLVK